MTFGILPLALAALLLGRHLEAAVRFCVLCALSHGVLTIVRGTVAQAFHGHAHTGAVSGAVACVLPRFAKRLECSA